MGGRSGEFEAWGVKSSDHFSIWADSKVSAACSRC